MSKKTEQECVITEEYSDYKPDGRPIEAALWRPKEEDLYFLFEDPVVRARFDKYINYEHEEFETFVIKKKHFKDNMEMICNHINYYIRFYDAELYYFMAMASIKILIDTKPNLRPHVFEQLILERIITDECIENLIALGENLHCVDIDTDTDNRYKSTPKLTNAHAKLFISVSFAYRLVMPICVHYIQTHQGVLPQSQDALSLFSRLFTKIIRKFEVNHGEIYLPLCRIIEHRIDKVYKIDTDIHNKKKQIHGTNYELYIQYLIHEIAIVNALYKLDYRKSLVSFIDGVVNLNYKNQLIENFKVKPVELTAMDNNSDSDESMSKAEAIEMSVYQVDESNILLNEANVEKVMDMIRKKFRKYLGDDALLDEEIQFYNDHCILNEMNRFLLNSFFSKYFNSSTATNLISRDESIELLVYLKRFLYMKHMVYLPQVCTAVAHGKFKEQITKNSKFLESVTSSTAYQDLAAGKFKYAIEVNPKNNVILKTLSTIINSSFSLIDTNSNIHGFPLDNLDSERLKDEFFSFLYII